ncbi:hypothetical protein BASA60_003172, partial [Batrachochytrium salamandrivorans]
VTRIENQALQQGIRPENLREPKAALPDKFDGTRRHFRGFINQLELVFQLQDQRYDTDRKKIATLGTLLTDKALSWYNPYIEQPERYAYDLSSWSAFQSKNERLPLVRSTRSKYPRPSSGLSDKDHLVHCESPVSLAAAMDQAFGSTTGFLNGDRSSSTTLDHSDETHLQLNLFLASTLSSTNSNMFDNSNHQQIQQPSAPTTATPVQQRPTSNDMDIDLLVVVLSLLLNDNRGLVKDSALFAVSQDTSKPLVPVQLSL